MSNENQTNTLTKLEIQEINETGWKVIEIYERILHKKNLKYLLSKTLFRGY